LALDADFGGIGTLIGSSAGVVAVGLSEKFGHHISLTRWIRIGFPFMLITLANRNNSSLWISYANSIERELL
jgi:Na+/H+ antiporter NhaD/arsenite permease-like protein